MGESIKLRHITALEEAEIRQLVVIQNAPHRLIQRAKVIAALLDDPKLDATQAALQAGFKSWQSGIKWVRRFNEEGMVGLWDRPKCGRPAVYDQEVRRVLVSLALQRPDALGYPFKLWTLERLQTALEERQGVHVSDITIWKWIESEGYVWKRQRSCFK
jgi:transposase